MSGLLVIAAHPDDEVLLAGGALAGCSAAGEQTAVACLTRGEEGPISDPAVTREQLPGAREAELRAACSVLGVGQVRCFDHADAHLPWAPAAEIAGQLARLVARHRFDAVITFWEDGLYWHPDHLAVLEFARLALAQLTDPPPLFGSTWPLGHATAITAELALRGLPDSLWGLPPAAFGSDQLEEALQLDVSAFVTQKLCALRCHRTQLASAHAAYSMPLDLAARWLGTEWLLPAGGGPDSGWLADAVARGAAAAGRPADAEQERPGPPVAHA